VAGLTPPVEGMSLCISLLSPRFSLPPTHITLLFICVVVVVVVVELLWNRDVGGYSLREDLIAQHHQNQNQKQNQFYWPSKFAQTRNLTR